MTTTVTTNLDAIDARVRDCQTYNFGMRNADQLAHVDAPALSAALRAVLDLVDVAYKDVGPGGVAAPDSIDAADILAAITTHLEGAS